MPLCELRKRVCPKKTLSVSTNRLQTLYIRLCLLTSWHFVVGSPAVHLIVILTAWYIAGLRGYQFSFPRREFDFFERACYWITVCFYMAFWFVEVRVFVNFYFLRLYLLLPLFLIFTLPIILAAARLPLSCQTAWGRGMLSGLGLKKCRDPVPLDWPAITKNFCCLC